MIVIIAADVAVDRREGTETFAVVKNDRLLILARVRVFRMECKKGKSIFHVRFID